eukprot:1246993-Ditylum_brightwellii.AAC.1
MMKTWQNGGFSGPRQRPEKSEVLWWISRVAGRATVASFVLVDKRGSPHLGKLVEVLTGVAQAL